MVDKGTISVTVKKGVKLVRGAGIKGMGRLWKGLDLAAMVHARFYPPFLQPPYPFSLDLCWQFCWHRFKETHCGVGGLLIP